MDVSAGFTIVVSCVFVEAAIATPANKNAQTASDARNVFILNMVAHFVAAAGHSGALM